MSRQASTWRKTPLGTVAKIGNGSTPRRTYREYWDNGTIPWLTSAKANERRILEADEFVTPKARSEAHLPLVPARSLVVAITGEGKTLGRVGIVGFETAVSQHLAYITVHDKKMEPDFLFHYLDSQYESLREAGQGGGTTKGALTCGFLARYEVPVPPIEEQRAIAAALSDADALIAALDDLIAKKRATKQGAMQQLLTGRTRLPGFAGEWETSTLGALGRWRGGMTPSMKINRFWDSGTIPWASSADVREGALFDTASHITEEAVRETSVPVVPKDSVLIVMRSGILRRFIPVALAGREMAINQDIKALLPEPSISARFVQQALHLHEREILSTCLKAGTTVESIEFGWLKSFTLKIPALKEQRAIASVLSDMDAEIVALERRREKMRAIKQGMMQSLLTGRVRLTHAGAEV